MGEVGWREVSTPVIYSPVLYQTGWTGTREKNPRSDGKQEKNTTTNNRALLENNRTLLENNRTLLEQDSGENTQLELRRTHGNNRREHTD